MYQNFQFTGEYSLANSEGSP